MAATSWIALKIRRPALAELAHLRFAIEGGAAALDGVPDSAQQDVSPDLSILKF